MINLFDNIRDFFDWFFDNIQGIIVTLSVIFVLGSCMGLFIHDSNEKKILYKYQYITTNPVGDFEVIKYTRGNSCSMAVMATIPKGSYEITMWRYGHRSPDYMADISKIESNGTSMELYNGDCGSKIHIAGISNGKLVNNEFKIPYRMTKLGPVDETTNEIKK
jgi:hypothetical protein